MALKGEATRTPRDIIRACEMLWLQNVSRARENGREGYGGRQPPVDAPK